MRRRIRASSISRPRATARSSTSPASCSSSWPGWTSPTFPYKGTGPAVQDLMGGQVDLFITTPAGVVSQIQAGKLKGLAVTSQKRLPSLPNVPTAAEAGLKGYELDSWFALYAPAGTPADVVQLLNTEVNRILQSPEVRKKAQDAGTEVETMTPQQFAEFTRKELDHWGRVIRDARISVE